MARNSKGRGKSKTTARKTTSPRKSKATPKKASPAKTGTQRAKASSKARVPTSPRARKSKTEAAKTAVTLIARDPVTAFAAWDTSPDALPAPGVLRVLQGEKVHQKLEVSLDWGGASIAGLEPGKVFRVELSAGQAKKVKRLGISNSVKLPGRGAQPPRVTSPSNSQNTFVFVTPGAVPPRPANAADPEPGFAASRQQTLIEMSTPGANLTSSAGGSTLSGRR